MRIEEESRVESERERYREGLEGGKGKTGKIRKGLVEERRGDRKKKESKKKKGNQGKIKKKERHSAVLTTI